MSDLGMYELEDIAWDELGQIGDHIVPHPSNEHEDEPAYEEGNFKKLQHEVIGVSSNAGHSFSTTYANQEEERSIQHQKKRRTKSSERESWLHLTEDIIPDSRDSGFGWELAKVSSDSVRVPGQCLMSSNIETIDAEFCANDTIADEGCAVNDTNFCAYSLDDLSQTENDLSFLDNDCEDNGSASLLYYGWPDIENFEDGDRMFRSCDSTFGFGSSNEDNLAWLSSSHNIEQCEGILKSDFSPLKNRPEQDLSKLNNASCSANDSNIGISYISYKSGFEGSESGVADPLGNMASMNGSVISDREGKLTPKEQQNIQFGSDIHFDNSTAYQSTDGSGQRKKQATRPNLSEGKRKDRHKSCQVFAHPDHQKQKKNVAPNAFGYLQTPTPYMHLNYIYPSDPISVGSQLSSVKSEINSLTSASPRESSHASNQARSMESSHCHPFGAPVMSVDDKVEKLRRRKGFYHSPVSKQVGLSQNEAENHSGVERGNVANPADIDSSNVPETSCMSSGFDEISLEASSFHQLQQVMEQLDIRTKLCIRDSLYRLARSAEQRHRYANMKGGGQSHGEAGDAFMADGSNNGFMDMETDTNPIDRLVAHLLFHRPSDSSAMPAHDGSSLKPHTMIHESIASPPLMVEQLVCREEAATEAEKKISITDDS